LRGYASCPVPETLQLAVDLALDAAGGTIRLRALAGRLALATGLEERLSSSAILRLAWAWATRPGPARLPFDGSARRDPGALLRGFYLQRFSRRLGGRPIDLWRNDPIVRDGLLPYPPSAEDLRVLMGWTERRLVTRRGVQIEHLLYQCDDLRVLRGQTVLVKIDL